MSFRLRLFPFNRASLGLSTQFDVEAPYSSSTLIDRYMRSILPSTLTHDCYICICAIRSGKRRRRHPCFSSSIFHPSPPLAIALLSHHNSPAAAPLKQRRTVASSVTNERGLRSSR